MWPFKKKKVDTSISKEEPDCPHVWVDDGFAICTVPNETFLQHCIKCGWQRVTYRPRGASVSMDVYRDSGKTLSWDQPLSDDDIGTLRNREFLSIAGKDGGEYGYLIMDNDGTVREKRK